MGGKLKDFKAHFEGGLPEELKVLKEEVEAFAKQFPTIGFEKSQMKYKE